MLLHEMSYNISDIFHASKIFSVSIRQMEEKAQIMRKAIKWEVQLFQSILKFSVDRM